jgi:hypothetical protein
MQIGRLAAFGRGEGGAGSPELSSRGGASPELADLGAPGSILDEIKP